MKRSPTLVSQFWSLEPNYCALPSSDTGWTWIICDTVILLFSLNYFSWSFTDVFVLDQASIIHRNTELPTDLIRVWIFFKNLSSFYKIYSDVPLNNKLFQYNFWTFFFFCFFFFLFFLRFGFVFLKVTTLPIPPWIIVLENSWEDANKSK